MLDYDKIKLIVLDVDGTLTDGGIYYDSNGYEVKRFDVKDGLGIKVGIAAGLQFAIITGRKSYMVEKRAGELGIKFVYQNVVKKEDIILDLMSSLDFSKEEVAYMGDDYNDIKAMRMVGVAACPSDAPIEIRNTCQYIASHQGGAGAVRDFVEEILEQRNEWWNLIEMLY